MTAAVSMLIDEPTADPSATDLLHLMGEETRLIGELRRALERQRAGVATDDAAAVESATQAVARTVLTLDAVRHRRLEATATFTAGLTADLAELERLWPDQLPASVQAARVDLRRSAEAAARDVTINQAVLKRALDAGDAFLQKLFGSAAEPADTPPSSPGTAPAARIFDLTA